MGTPFFKNEKKKVKLSGQNNLEQAIGMGFTV
jgi:hypothetical protein